MPEIDASQPAGAAPAGDAPAGQGMQGLDSDAFMQLLMAQMQHQNPMEPADSTEMLQQSAMFAQVEAINGIADQQQELIGFQQAEMASGLVGQQVRGVDADGEEVAGVVDAVRFTDAGPRLQLGDAEVAVVDVTEVHAPPA